MQEHEYFVLNKGESYCRQTNISGMKSIRFKSYFNFLECIFGKFEQMLQGVTLWRLFLNAFVETICLVASDLIRRH